MEAVSLTHPTFPPPFEGNPRDITLHYLLTNLPVDTFLPQEIIETRPFTKWLTVPISFAVLPLALLALNTYFLYTKIRYGYDFASFVANYLVLYAHPRINPQTLSQIRASIFPPGIYEIQKGTNKIRAVTTTMEGNIKLGGVHISPSQNIGKSPEKRKYIVYFNGIGSAWENNIAYLTRVAETTGDDVISFNYQGIGLSESFAKTSKDLKKSAAGMLGYLKNIPEPNILLYGFSLGGGVASTLLPKHPELNYLNDRSFATFELAAKAIAGNLLPWLPLYQKIFTLVICYFWHINSIANVRKATKDPNHGMIFSVFTKQDTVVLPHISFLSGYIKENIDIHGALAIDYEVDHTLSYWDPKRHEAHTYDLPMDKFLELIAPWQKQPLAPPA